MAIPEIPEKEPGQKPHHPRGGGRVRGFQGLLVAVILVLSFFGCGKKEWPWPPDVLLPGPVSNLQVHQEGEALVLTWEAPRKNLLGRPLTQLEGYRLYRAVTPGVVPPKGCPPEFVLLADIDLEYPQGCEVEGERLKFQDRRLEPGKGYHYRVAAYGRGGVLGAWSPPVYHPWDFLPQAPENLQAQAGDKEVWLTWEPVRTLANGAALLDLVGYVVLRRTSGSPWQRLTPKPQTPLWFQDITVDNDIEYIYTIRAVRQVGGYLLESLDARPRLAKPEDVTPPPPPRKVVAVPTREGVELRWDPSPAPDLAGYRVYRRKPGEKQVHLLTPQLLPQPYFVDRQVAPGKVYFYLVTAVDNSPRKNESEPSEAVSVPY